MKRLAVLIFAALAFAQQGPNLRRTISLSAASGNVEIIPVGVGTYKIRHVIFSLAATTDVKYVQGTGTACGTGGVDITGTFKTVQSLADDIPAGAMELLPGRAFCINFSTASTGGGYVIYDN